VPLFLSVALGLSAIATGVRLLPLSITLLLAAVGVPKFFPHASPRRVSRRRHSRTLIPLPGPGLTVRQARARQGSYTGA
jgi:hypothetical protein